MKHDAQEQSVAGGATATKAPTASMGRGRRFFDFFWRGRDLRQARAVLAQRSVRDQRLLEYVRATAELGDRALNPIDPLRAGSGIPIAVTLYREALRTSVTLMNTTIQAITADSELAAALGGEQAWQRACQVAFETTSSQELDAGRPITRADATQLRQLVYHFIERFLAPECRVRKVLLQRWFRLGTTLLLIGLSIAAVVALLVRLTRTPNLLAGKSWRASSTYAFDSQKTDIFFHTNEELNPWIEFDLQKPTPFSLIDVENRSDCCTDRAIPLILEGSNDRLTWREIVRREKSFGDWSARFAPVEYRYVRLRAAKRTLLHLEEVEVR